MAERSVSLYLRAVVDGFKRSMREAAESVKGIGDETDKQSRRSTSALGKLAEHARENEQAFNTIGTAALAMGAAAAVGVGAAVSKFADFDQAMSSVRAATHETAENMALLREAAITAGEDTAFSAVEAASAIEEMAKAGVSTADILGGGLSGALDLAAAGTMDVGVAAELAATAMTQFGLAGEDLPHVADLLAAGAGKAQGSVEDMGAALKQAGLVADQTGLSIEETTGGLAAFASAGMVGSDAGTSFKSMLQRLTPQSKEAQRAMDELGISAYDSQGNFIGLAEFAGVLETALADLTPQQRNAAMATIFGSDAVRAASVIYEQGEEGVRDWIAAVDDQGYAAETAALKLDNLKGDLEALGGSMETALIQTGSVANDTLRGLVQRLDALVGAYNNLPPAAQGATLAVGGTVSAVGLLGGGALVAVPKLVEFYDALGKMGAAGQRTQGFLKGAAGVLMGPWGVALAAGTVALGIYAEQQYRAAQYVDGLSGSLDRQTGAISDSTREIVRNDLAARDGWWVFQKSSTFDAAEKLGLDLEMVTDAAMGNRDAMDQLNAELERWDAAMEASSAGRDLREQMGIEPGEWTDYVSALARVREGVEGNNTALDEAARLTEQKAEADAKAKGETEGAAEAQEVLNEALSATEAATDEATAAIDDLINALNTLNGVGRSAIDTQIAWEAAVDAAEKALSENGKTLDLNTEAGRANMQALQGMAKDAEELAAAILRETGSEEKMRSSLADSRKALRATAIEFGMSEAEADAYVDRVLSVPTTAKTSIQLNGAQDAMARIDALNAKLNSLNGTTSQVAVNYRENRTIATIRQDIAEANGGVLDFYANGGFSENHVAQIAPAGAWRVWAEPETGGEAYIPLAPSKRDRSVAIWEETGARLGVLAKFADGGITGQMVTAGSASRSQSMTVVVPVQLDGREVTRVIANNVAWESA